MANNSDGSLVFDTELDNEGFEKGSDKLLSSIDSLTKQVNTLGSDMRTAFSGITSILQNLAAASQGAANNTANSAQQATQAAQATAQAQAQAATATTNAAKATANYDKELARLQKKISTAKGNLSEYYKELDSIRQSTDDSLAQTTSDEQAVNMLEIEQIQIDSVNQKYAAKIAVLQQLEAEYARVAAARDAANQPAAEPTTTSAGQTGGQNFTDVSQAAQTATGGVNNFRSAFRAALREMLQSSSFGSRVVSVFSGLKSVMSTVGGAVARLGKSLRKITFNAIAAGAKKAISGLKSFAKQSHKTTLSAETFAKSLTRLRRMLISRIKEKFITSIFQGIGEGLQKLAQFDSKFNSTMSNIKNSATQLTGNISVAAANIISTLEPVIMAVLNLLSKAISYVNQFFALLSGKRSYTVAKKGTDSYAESAENAAAAQKEFNAELYSFDELNRQSKQDDSSGGGSDLDETGVQYEEVPIDLPQSVQDWIERLKEAWQNGDWYGVGQVIAEGLNYAIKAVDDWINNTLRPEGVKWAGRFAEIMNGLTDGIDWPMLGKTIADGCNAIADIYNTFMYEYDWDNLGKRLGEGLNGLVDNVEWDTIGKAFAAQWQALVRLIHGFVHEVKWAELGKNVGEGIYTWFTSIEWVKLADAVVTGLNGVVTALRNAITAINWGEVGKILADSITTLVTGIDWGNIWGLLSDAIKNLLRLALELISNIDWFAVGSSITQGILDMLTGIDWETILKTLGALVVNVVMGAVNLILGAIAGIAQTLAEAFLSVGKDGIAGFFQGVSNALADLGTWIKENIVDPVVNWVKNLFGIHSPSTVFAEIGRNVIAGLLEGISTAWQSITEFFSGAISNLTSFLSEGWSNIVSNAKSAWNNLKTNVTTAFNNAKTGLANTATQIGNGLSGTWTNVKSSAQNAWSNLRSNVTTAFDNAKTGLNNTASQIKSNLSSTWSNVYSNAQSAFSNIRTTISNTFNNARTSVLNTASNMRSNLSTAFSGIVSNANSAWSALRTNTLNYFSNLRTNVLNAWNNLRTNMNNIKWNNVGHNLVAGLNNGVAGAWGGFMSNVSTMVNNLIRRIKSLFGIHSPSKVFAEIGEFLDMGLEQGMNDGERSLLSTAKNIATAVTDGMTPDSPNVQMNVDSVVGSMQAVISSLGSLATTFQTIANALTSMGGFTMPQIAAGTVAPYQTRVAATTAPAEDIDGVTAYLLGILSELQALARSMQNGDGSGEQVIQVNVDGNKLFDFVVNRNNRAVRNTGKSPLKV